MHSYLRRGSRHRFAANPFGRIFAAELNTAIVKGEIEVGRRYRKRRLVGHRNAGAERLQRYETVKRSAVEIAKAKLAGDAGRDRPLSGRCRTVDGDNEWDPHTCGCRRHAMPCPQRGRNSRLGTALRRSWHVGPHSVISSSASK